MKKLGTAIVVGVATLAAATSISAASTAKSTAVGQKNIVQTAVAAGQFKTLVALVKQAGLVGALSGPGPLTVFAPTDAAFAKVPKSTLAALGKNKAQLKDVLLYHVVPPASNLGGALGMAVICLTGGFVFFHVQEPRFARLN